MKVVQRCPCRQDAHIFFVCLNLKLFFKEKGSTIQQSGYTLGEVDRGYKSEQLCFHTEAVESL